MDTKLGGLDINNFCTLNKNGEAQVANGAWVCSGDGKAIDMNLLCQTQYNQPTAYAKENNAGDVYSYVCYLPATPPPPPPVPAFVYNGTADIVYDGQGNFTVTIKGTIKP